MSTTPLFASEQSAATSRCPVQDEATRTNATALRKGSTHHKPLILHGYLVGYPTITAWNINPRHSTTGPLLSKLLVP